MESGRAPAGRAFPPGQGLQVAGHLPREGGHLSRRLPRGYTFLSAMDKKCADLHKLSLQF